MAVLSALRRFARLGLWVGLGAGAMLIDACNNDLGHGRRDSAPDVPTPAIPDAAATPDAGSDARGIHLQAIDADHAQPEDGSTALWDTICE